MKSTIEDKDKLAEKVSDDEKQTIQEAVQEAQDWLNANEDADKDEFEEKMKDL